MLRHPFALAIGATVASLVSGVPATADTPAGGSRVTIGLTFDPSVAADVRIHDFPRVVHATPIVPPPGIAESLKPDTWGRITLRIDETGTVRHVGFPDDRPGKSLARLLEDNLKAWRFEPPVVGGSAHEARITFIYSARFAPPSTEESPSARPALVYMVAPVYPHDLLRPPDPRSSNASTGARIDTELGVRATSNPRTGAARLERVVLPVLRADGSNLSMVESGIVQSWFPAAVQLALKVDPSGRPVGATVVDSTCSAFEPAAVLAALAWRFDTGEVDPSHAARTLVDVVRFVVPDSRRPVAFISQADRQPSVSWHEPPRFAHLALPVFPHPLGAEIGTKDVRIRLHVDRTGKLVSVAALESTFPELTGAAIAALRASQFIPATRDRRAVEAHGEITVRFSRTPQSEDPESPVMPALVLDFDEEQSVMPAKSLDRPPRRLIGRAPVFCRADLAGEDSGAVTLDFVIDPFGRVRTPQVVKASTPAIGYAAVQAVSTWLFDPPQASGKRVATRVRAPIQFMATAATE